MADIDAGMQLSGEHLHQAQAEGVGLPPVETRRQAPAVVAHAEADPAVRAAAKRHGHFAAATCGCPRPRKACFSALLASSLRISPQGTAAFTESGTGSRSRASRTPDAAVAVGAPEIVQQTFRVFGELHPGHVGRLVQLLVHQGHRAHAVGHVLEDPRMAASGKRSACKATRLEITCMLFFTR